jgi:hypothetical protein
MMSDNELLLAYRDQVTEETVQQLLSITELKLAQAGEEKKLRKRIFNILVECLQNIVNHSAKGKNEEELASLLLLGKRFDYFFIVTGNRIDNSKVEPLKKRIEEINSWNHEEMRDIFSDKLDKSEFSEKGGAGLGLIDIYRKSGRQIEYEFDPVDENTSFVSLNIEVDSFSP